MADNFEQRVTEALANPQNMGEMENADAVGTVGSPGCGDMLRMWIKFKEDGGKKVIDRATFQGFGCETAIAVASLATELIKGKTAEEAMKLSGAELAEGLGALPPMKIHCGQLVEGALRSALDPQSVPTPAPSPNTAGVSQSTLLDSLSAGSQKAPVKITFLPKDA
jgi:nitrogen fixation NifU-like protein